MMTLAAYARGRCVVGGVCWTTEYHWAAGVRWRTEIDGHHLLVDERQTWCWYGFGDSTQYGFATRDDAMADALRWARGRA